MKSIPYAYNILIRYLPNQEPDQPTDGDYISASLTFILQSWSPYIATGSYGFPNLPSIKCCTLLARDLFQYSLEACCIN